MSKDSVSCRGCRCLCYLVAAGCLAATSRWAAAQGLSINEIYFNQPGRKNFNTDPDSTHAYVELRGAPCASLANTYLVFLENEGAGAGSIEGLFDLSSTSLGANGYLTIRQRTVTDPAHPTQYNDYAVHPKATNLRNEAPGDVGLGFGSLGNSTVGASWDTNSTAVFSGGFEGSGFTALLIQTDGQAANAPTLLFDVDVDDNGFDVPNGHAGWTIRDSIGLFAEANEALTGRTYAPLTFGFESTADFPDFNPADHIPAGGTYVFLDWAELEAEYIGRWGNSTGHDPNDWHVSNLTDRPTPAGFTNTGDFRQSAQPHGSTEPIDWETSHGVPYGTAITTTLGSPNYPLNLLTAVSGDFDGDGDVDQSDLVDQWMPRFAHGDLDGNDYLAWQRNLGYVTPPVGAAQSAVPEPNGEILAGACLAATVAVRRVRRA